MLNRAGYLKLAILKVKSKIKEKEQKAIINL